MKKCKQEGEPETHPSQDATDRYSDDQLLRQYGYRIHARPLCGEATWSKGGVVVGHREALRSVHAVRRVR